MKLLKRLKIIHWVILFVLFITVAVVWARTPKQALYGIRFRDEGAAPSTPPSGYGEVYVNSDTLYFKDDNGTATSLILSGTLLDDIGDPDAATSIDLTDYALTIDAGEVDADMVNIEATAAFGNISVFKIEQKTGDPTDGTLLELKLAAGETDPDFCDFSIGGSSKFNVSDAGNVTIAGSITGAASAIDFTEFDVSGTTGAITINDGGDAGSITIEGSVFDINSLDFVGAGAITAAASSAITLNPNAGNAAGEDLIVTAHNVQLTAAGKLTMSPDAAETLAIDLTDTDYTNAISVGDNAILGTTGLINYTNFDVDAAGGVVCTSLDAGSGNITTTGTISATTISQDAIVASSANTALTLDGTGTGGVSIGTTGGTGAITLGGTSTAVNLASATDLTLAGGSVSVTDTANSDLITLVNNTMTTADIIDISATGTRTSGGVLKIVDSATTASTIAITADSATTGNVIAVQADALEAGGAMLYLDSDAIPDTSTYYIECAGTGTDFTVAKDGVTTMSGVASTDVITVTTGDVQIDDGKLEIDTDEDDTTKVERAQATVTGPVFSVVEQTHTAASGKAALFVDQDTTTNTSSAIEIDTEGAWAVKIDELIAAGDGIKFDVANSYTGQGIVADLGPWLGTTGEGFISIITDSGAVNEVGQAIRVNLQGTGTAGTAVEGKAFHAESQAAVKAGESLVYLDTLTNTAIHIDNEGTAADGIKFDVANSYTGQGIVADLGPWLGTAGEGFIDIDSDSGAVAEAGHIIHITMAGTTADAAAISGKGLYIKDAAAATASSYLVHVESDNNGAAYLDGDIDVKLSNNDDFLSLVSNATDYAAGAGVITVYDDSAGQDNVMYLLRLATEANGDAQNAFILCEDASDGTAGNGDDMFKVAYDGATTMEGSLTVSGAQIIGDGATEMVGVKHDVVDGAATNPYTVTIAMSGTVFYNTQAIEFDLPEASTAIGCEYTFVVQHASNLDIDPEASDKLLGLCDSAGDKVRSSTVGDTITLVCIDGTNWVAKSTFPASTDWPDSDA